MSAVRDPGRDQPLPVPTEGPSTHDLAAADILAGDWHTLAALRAATGVVQDLAERKAYGLRKYGSLLQTGNGRDFVIDAYEEALDLVAYARGGLDEGVIDRDIYVHALALACALRETLDERVAGTLRPDGRHAAARGAADPAPAV